TLNRADYGGMDVYTINLLGGAAHHDDFYTSEKVKKAFKNYVRVFVNRYKNSPAIMSWQLANEPRCGADGVRNLPRSDNCDNSVIGAWVREMSDFIKSI